MSERREEALAIAEDVAYLTVPERLIRVFARLAQEHGKPVAGGTLLDIRLTQNDLASLIGSTRETVSLKFGELVRSGTIRLDDRAIVILR